ncbi:MAG: N-acetylmuramoyl-L-alanine amidase, partial [Alphaproteobacteria bacterium]|nr:N-acetylmuramoyl-L-alanine amidase [Alphaproteobacteria bacterium]
GVDLGDYSDDVQNILIDFAQAKTNELSVKFARDMLIREIGQRARLLGRPWRSAGFAVLKAPDVPSVLLELGYTSNLKEEKLLLSKSYKEKVSAAIVRAVDAYFKSM